MALILFVDHRVLLGIEYVYARVFIALIIDSVVYFAYIVDVLDVHRVSHLVGLV